MFHTWLVDHLTEYCVRRITHHDRIRDAWVTITMEDLHRLHHLLEALAGVLAVRGGAWRHRDQTRLRLLRSLDKAVHRHRPDLALLHREQLGALLLEKG